jgi:hypothetical protein
MSALKIAYCSFCGKSQHAVRAMVARLSPDLFICNECVSICIETLTSKTHRCATCDHFNEHTYSVDEKDKMGEVKAGYCVRYAPRQAPLSVGLGWPDTDQHRAVWPTVGADDRCGEWAPYAEKRL